MFFVNNSPFNFGVNYSKIDTIELQIEVDGFSVDGTEDSTYTDTAIAYVMPRSLFNLNSAEYLDVRP